MPSILASAILDKAGTILQDVTKIRWATAELLGWLNDGQREVVIIRPDASVSTKAVLLAAGTKQTLGAGATADAISLLKVVRNMGTTGTTPGAAIRIVSGEILDAQVPDWHSGAQSAAVVHAVYDPRVPKQFYVYPPNTGTGFAEISYSSAPAAIAASTDLITIDDVFANALLDYVLYRAYSKDAVYAGNGNRALAHYQAFLNTLGARAQNLAANNPNLENMPFNPTVPGASK